MQGENALAKNHDALSDWAFSVAEISDGWYRASGKSDTGFGIEVDGDDPATTLRKCKVYATELASRTRSAGLP